MGKQDKCKICNEKVEQIKMKKEQIYYHCSNCDFIFMDQAFYLSAEEEKEFYLTHENSAENEGYVQMFKGFITKGVQPYFAEIETALDYGAGPGPVLAMLLNEMGIETEIYDPYFAPEEVFVGKKYDLITSTEVFEHFANPMQELTHLSELLNEGGYLAVMTLLHQGVEQFPTWWYHRDPTHISFFSRKTFEWIATELRMKVAFCGEKNVCVLKK